MGGMLWLEVPRKLLGGGWCVRLKTKRVLREGSKAESLLQSEAEALGHPVCHWIGIHATPAKGDRVSGIEPGEPPGINAVNSFLGI